jgi:hypothetical protein
MMQAFLILRLGPSTVEKPSLLIQKQEQCVKLDKWLKSWFFKILIEKLGDNSYNKKTPF